jgi:protein MpaA
VEKLNVGLRLGRPGSKNRGMPSVKTCPLDPADLVAQCGRAATAEGFRIERFGEHDGVPLSALTRRNPGVRPRIYLSAGVHGDEPAPPLAIVELLRSGALHDGVNWFIVPMLNPSGFRPGRRENSDGIDLNRDYRTPKSQEVAAHIEWLQHQPRFDLALCLHEDWESQGFYLYELNPQMQTNLAYPIRTAAAEHMCIEDAEVIDGRPIDEKGIIRPESDPVVRETWPEAIYLREHHTDLCYTLETASSYPIAQRINTHIASVLAAVEALLSASAGTAK